MQIKERICMALALYHEARGEPLAGQVAVALAILNRVASPLYPSTICKVVFQHAALARKAGRRNCQFSFACGRRSLLPRNPAIFLQLFRLGTRIVDIVRHGAGYFPAAENTRLRRLAGRFANVTHFHRHDVRPAWARRMRRVMKVGRHVFFSSGRVTGQIPPEIRLRRLFPETGITHASVAVRL